MLRGSTDRARPSADRMKYAPLQRIVLVVVLAFIVPPV